MGRLVLFDGGIAGGIYIHCNTVRPIPAFSTQVLAHLRAVNDLLRSTREQSMDTDVSSDLLGLTNKAANLAIERVEAAIGPLDGGDSLVYLDGKHGFICGSTGAPPRSFDWPPVNAVEDFIQRGLMGADVIEFLRRAHEKGLRVTDILEDPIASAMIAGVELSDLAVANLRLLSPSQLDKIPDPVNRGVLRFFHMVLQDGRFLDTWMTDPAAVANSLGVELDPEVIDRILGSSAMVGHAPEVARLSISQGIVVGIVALLVADRPPDEEPVEDLSGLVKF